MSELNLIPREVKLHEELKTRKLKIVISIVVLSLILITINSIPFYILYIKNAKNSEFKLEIAKLSHISSEVNKLNERKKLIQERIKATDEISRMAKSWTVILSDISLVMPEDITVNSLDASGQYISIQCTSPAQRSIAVFMANIENSKKYSSVKLNEIVPYESAFRFSIILEIKETESREKQ